MIIEHRIKGSKETTFHNFMFEQNGMDLKISSGNYFRNNQRLYSTDAEGVITIPIPSSDTQYKIWLKDDGIGVLSKTQGVEFGDILNPIDRLAWFTVPANTTTLDNVEIHVVKVVE